MIKLLLWSIFLSFCSVNSAMYRESERKQREPNEKTLYSDRYTGDGTFGKNYEIVVPRKVRPDGGFISHQIPHHYKRSYYKGRKRGELKPEDILHYRVSINDVEYHLELYPNHRLVAPAAVVEERTASFKDPSRKIRNYDFIDDSKFKKLRDTQCHYHGRVRHQRDVTALSTCYGLVGYIRTKRSLYMIEPIEHRNFTLEGAHPHMVYRASYRDRDEKSTLLCNITGFPSMRFANEAQNLVKRNLKKMKNRAYTIELLAVLDKQFLESRRSLDVENYVLTHFNMAAGLFQDESLGVVMELVIVRIIRLEVEEDEIDLSVNKDVEGTMKHFQAWQKRINPGDDAHPNHHDCAILITKTDMCITQSFCGFTGMSTIAGTCDPLKGAIVIKDDGLQTGYGIAHHLGHTIGMAHDVQDENGCAGVIPHQDGYIETTVMYPGYNYITKRWSKCSQNYVQLYIEAGLASCLKDEAQDHHFPSIEMLPGVMYNADDQCRLRFHENARQCDLGITCDTLKCTIPGMGCVFSNVPPAEGTSCGEKRWCYEMKCLVIGDRPLAIDGGWSSWSTWSHCSRTCGSGIASSQRKCNNPQPSRGGRYCVGESKRHKICASDPCEVGAPSFRDVQCSEFNDWIFPEDGKIHQWLGYNLPENMKASENPCALYCLSETKLLTSLRTKVVDGTTCYRGIRDICVRGVCREIPCDLDMESDAIEDMCGVCRGDSTSCILKEGVVNVLEQQKLKKVADVPTGAKNIRVEELQPTKSRIVLRTKKTKTVLIDGNRLGMFDLPGSKAWLGMIRAKQEALNIPGPVTEDLVILVHPRENVTLKYSLGLKPGKPRKPSFEWSFIEWTRCTAPCGPGEQISKPCCIEKIGGQVDKQFCKYIPKPEVKVRPCNQAPCIPRWMIGDWQGCEKCTSTCMKFRVVKCVRPVGHGEQETDVISDSYCEGPKPKESMNAICRDTRGNQAFSKILSLRQSDRNKIENVQAAVLPANSVCTGKTVSDLAKRSKTFKNLKNVEQQIGPDIYQISNRKGPENRPEHPKSLKKLALSSRSGMKRSSEDSPESIKINKGQVIMDKEDIKNLTLTIILERDDTNVIINFPKDFQPQPSENSTEFVLTGMDAVNYIQRMQQIA